jgi:hypothetical protein
MVICRIPQYFEQMEELFCQLLNVHGVNEVRHAEMHTAEQLITKPSSLYIEVAF